jgi:hypothetical protein
MQIKGNLNKSSQLFGVKGGYENKLLGAIKQGQKLNDIMENYRKENNENRNKKNPLEK